MADVKPATLLVATDLDGSVDHLTADEGLESTRNCARCSACAQAGSSAMCASM